MEPFSSWEAALLAAGITTVYNADDWERMGDKRASESSDAASNEGRTPQH